MELGLDLDDEGLDYREPIFFEHYLRGVERLRAAGLYIRSNERHDWTGRGPALIHGGTHVDDGGGIRIVHNAFIVGVSDNAPGYQVRYPGQGQLVELRHFDRFSEAIKFVLSNWRPPKKDPTRPRPT